MITQRWLGKSGQAAKWSFDLRPKGTTGKDADEALERASITCNKKGVPFDPLPPTKTSGIRVGSPADTTRGFGPAEFAAIGDMIADVLGGLAANGPDGNAAVEKQVKDSVRAHCSASRFTRRSENVRSKRQPP